MVQLENMPEYLRETGRFCLWKYEDRAGRKTKVSYNPKNPEHRARSNDPSTFCTWAELLEIWPQVQDRFFGIGIGMFGDLFAIDIDHCLVDGRPSQMAMYIINRVGSHTEISPSVEGIRIFGRHEPGLQYDRSKYYINNREKGLEIYIEGITNKFLTFTGNTIRAAPVRVVPSEIIQEILDKFMKRPEKAPEPAGASDREPLQLTDSEILQKAEAARDGRKFMQLYSGDYEGAGYTSQSEADQALCNMLAFWTGRDAGQIDRIFRSSGLMRKKWERADYRTATINKAIRDCREVYTGPQRESAAEDFAEDPEESKSTLPEPETFTAETLQNLPELRPSIIEGLLRAGHKMMIAGPSKAGKSFSMIELALAFASGTEWLGFQCKRCRVLYCNLEVDGDSFKHRIAAIMEKLEISPAEIGDRLKLWNLRGKAAELSTMLSTFKEQARGCDVLILDPIYKIMEGDENSASEMGKFTRNLDRLAEEGAAIIYAHHFGKATQKAYDDPMNRASGSGVFARDPDAILTMSALNMEYVTQEQRQTAGVTSRASGFQLDFTLREFAPHSPFKIWFDYPVHIEDNGALDGTTITGKSASSIDRAARCIAVLSKVFDDFKNEIEEDGGIDLRFLDGRVGSIGGKNKKNIGEKTIRRYAEDSRKYFYVKNGKLYRGTDFHNPEEATPFDAYDF